MKATHDDGAVNLQLWSFDSGTFVRRFAHIALSSLALSLIAILCAAEVPPNAKGDAQESQKPRITPNRIVPKVEAPSPTLNISSEPTARELAAVRVFSEPLVAIGGIPDAAENNALGQALRKHAKRADADDVAHLTDFLAAHPRGKWAASALFNLGTEYFNNGYWSKALDAWDKAWKLSSTATEPQAKALADRAVGELAMMYARLGRMSDLDALLQSLENRTIVGSASEKIAGAKQGLWSMKNVPGISFRCGPLALDRIRASQNPNFAANPQIQNAQSTTNGFSLIQLAQLSRELGMSYQAAHRESGAAFITPSVIHWKVGHYAALLRQDGQRYLVQDPTFRMDTWITARALEAESSGYFLVPPGALPARWRAVPDAEGATVWGKGQTSNNDPNDTTPDDKKKDRCPASNHGMAIANAHLMEVSLNIMDTPVGYQPPVGPAVYFTATYNQREANQPANFAYCNLGTKWTFNWLAYIKDNPSSPAANAEFYVPGGGTQVFTGFDTNTQTFANQIRSQALLKRTSTNSYEMLFPDGSKRIFNQPDGVSGTSRKVFLTQMFDSASNSVELTYDSQFRLVAIRDAVGQVTSLGYNHPTDALKITSVSDPFGRTAIFTYDNSGRLTNITDVINLNSQFTYEGSSDFISALTTPYGATRFAKGDAGRTRWLETTDPLGGTDRVEYSEFSNVGIPDGEPAALVPQGMFVRNRVIYARNTFYWDKKAFAEARGDYTKARIYHWLHSEDYSSAVGVLESIKMPFENRVWFNYPGQPQNNEGATVRGTSDRPTKIGRVLDDGTTQLYQYEYNTFGKTLKSIDPVGRTMTFVYDTNGVDLREVRQTTSGQNELVASILHNSQHRRISIIDAAGQLTTNTYNSSGQLRTTTNPLLETTTLVYDANGYLLTVDGSLLGSSDSLGFGYDDFGRINSFTDTDGYRLAFARDDLNRLKSIAYPDGTFQSFTYDKLDRTAAVDRQGRETHYEFNARRQLASVVDPLLRTNQFQWCDCGASELLVDAMGRSTHMERDLQGRAKEKLYADDSKIIYTYEITTSRLKSVQDEKGQLKVFDYYPDNKLKRVSYPNAIVATPTVTFTYDTNYARLRSMQDGIGTTTYGYHPAGILGALRLATVDGPWANDTVGYDYDSVGRVRSRSINGVAEALSFDALSRVTNVVNALGSFSYGYESATKRVSDLLYPNGQRMHIDYYDDSGDRRLREIRHTKPDTSLLSRFAYAYEPVGNITNWQQEIGGTNQVWTIGYDAADQVRLATVSQGSLPVKTFGYDYDPAGNHLFHTVDGVRSSLSYNALNELISGMTGRTTAAAYEWDGQHRLTAISIGTHRSEFAYDGVGRRARISERENGILQSERRFLWCSAEIVEARDATGAVVQQRFFRHGTRNEQGGGLNYFYASDHLLSVRQVTDASATVQSRIDYDLYGNRMKVGNIESDFGFAGYFWHGPSGLNMALMRAYDPSVSRWLSRDPLAERSGLNLFAYVRNRPTRFSDPLGTMECDVQISDPTAGGFPPPTFWFPPVPPNPCLTAEGCWTTPPPYEAPEPHEEPHTPHEHDPYRDWEGNEGEPPPGFGRTPEWETPELID